MRIAEELQVVPAIIPVDLSSGANAGDYISLKNFGHVTIAILTGIGTAGDDPVISINQATDVSGTGAKALQIDEVFHKVGATAINAVGEFTRATQTAADTYDTAGIDGAENEMLLLIEIDAADLDVDNNFDCLQLNIADVGTNAQIGSANYILSCPRYDAAEAIAD